MRRATTSAIHTTEIGLEKNTAKLPPERLRD
jgi:hypothetical protein